MFWGAGEQRGECNGSSTQTPVNKMVCMSFLVVTQPQQASQDTPVIWFEGETTDSKHNHNHNHNHHHNHNHNHHHNHQSSIYGLKLPRLAQRAVSFVRNEEEKRKVYFK
ncbi:hypothetical protein FHG87_003261 [Trinorchestia longiramus]|nr:hypothetical protein FHG87_003261 [Trinorchestia longiramus]